MRSERLHFRPSRVKMASPSEAVVFSADGVRAFILDKGGKVTNSQLARHYRAYLLDPERQEANKALFKQFISSVGSIRREGNEKYVILKKSDAASIESLERLDSNGPDDHHERSREPAEASTESASDRNAAETPVAPPRRKLMSSREASEDSNDSQTLSGNDENISAASNVSVKERAKKLNKMASESQLVLRPNNGASRNHRDGDNDKCSMYLGPATSANATQKDD